MKIMYKVSSVDSAPPIIAAPCASSKIRDIYHLISRENTFPPVSFPVYKACLNPRMNSS